MPTLIIPVSIPTIGSYSFQKLKDELTEYANHLVSQTKTNETKSEKKIYSSKLQRLHHLSHNNIQSSDIESDDRLAYLLSK